MSSIQDAEMFVAVVDAVGLSAGARRLGRSQPTVSRQLATLEARLGARLLERTTRQIRLTAAGRTYYERSRALLDHARETEALVAETNSVVRGSLRLSVPPTYARQRIAPLMPEFLRAHPDVRFEVVLTSERADVVGERLDLVVRLGPLPDSTLACRLLSREHFVVCAAPDYLARYGKPGTIAELAQRRCLVTETFGMRARWVFTQGRRRRAIDVPACLVSDDLGMLHAAARAGLGPCALPAYLVDEDFAAGTLVPILPRERLPSFRAHAVLPNGRHVPRRVRLFVDFLASQLRRGISPPSSARQSRTSSSPGSLALVHARRSPAD